MSTLGARLFGTGDALTAHCEFDDWTFSPRYTDGVCPLCGWRPAGAAEEPPLIERLDWFMLMLAAVVIASIVMGILVLHAYSQA
ncbi:MAG TPA: hypothetical protein VHL53_19145 [Acidimicrobiia bacterium]|nr:hypothetical protein [Acidimicrobiia bacterium]